MRRVCAWCNKFMGRNDDPYDGAEPITHTICDECADNLDFQLGVPLQRYLDSLKVPILLVDDRGDFLMANPAAREISPLPLPANREWEGKIYECSHARLPERCCHSIHSSGCTIRFATNETYATGRAIVSLPTLVNGCSSSPDQKCDYLVSTSLIEGIVHLKIEKA